MVPGLLAGLGFEVGKIEFGGVEEGWNGKVGGGFFFLLSCG